MHSIKNFQSVLKPFVACLLFFYSGVVANAQKTIAAPTQNAQLINQDTAVSAFEEKLVQLALAGPLYKGSYNENKINEYQLKKAKSAWLNILSLSVSYNEQSFSKNLQGPAIYPKYFFGLTVPLGTLFSKTEIKAANEQLALGQNNQQQLALNIRAQVLTTYRKYLMYVELIPIQTKITFDALSLFQQLEKKFKNEDKSVTIEAYTLASRSYNDELTKKLELELQKDLIRIELERMIGTSLENVK
jgi:hypothetical protein